MSLPNADEAVIAESKIAGYLLDSRHPDGATKAKFFLGLGFTMRDWKDLANELRNIAANSSTGSCVETRHGTKYIVDGRIRAPSGRSPYIRTVWIVDAGQTVPRFVTAYPTDSENER